jgi:hypothetical protein
MVVYPETYATLSRICKRHGNHIIEMAGASRSVYELYHPLFLPSRARPNGMPSLTGLLNN